MNEINSQKSEDLNIKISGEQNNEQNQKSSEQKISAKQKSAKKQNPTFVIMKRELSSYFTSPIAYIVGALFLIITGVFFFPTFFINRRADLRNFFSLLPIIFCFFIPALTMRVFSEEKRSGTIETLMTLPVKTSQIVWGKYLAALISSLVLLLPTLFYVITCCVFGKPDFGPIIGGYLGAIFLAASYCAIGIFASSVTKNQILSFFIAFAICGILTVLGIFSIFMPGFLVNVSSFISSESHFESISRGIIDSRDVLYFISLTAIFLALTIQSVKKTSK